MQKHIFLASIGNPGPLENTLHSAGHMVINQLAARLGAGPFTRSPTIQPGTMTSATTPTAHITLWKSPSLMNISGPALKRAWKSYLSTLGPASPQQQPQTRLFVLHDEMELALGKVRLKYSGSVRGHNGLRSVMESFGGGGGGDRMDWGRVGIGIGRPREKDREAVIAHVLRPARPREVEAIEGAVDDVCRVVEISA